MADKILDGDNFEIQRTKINQQVDEKGQLTDTVANSGRLKIAQGPHQQNLTPCGTVTIVGQEIQFSDDGNLIILDSSNILTEGKNLSSIQSKGVGHIVTIRCDDVPNDLIFTMFTGNIIMNNRYGTDGPSDKYIQLVPGMELSFIEVQTPYDDSYNYHFIGTNTPEKFKASIIDSSISASPWQLVIDGEYSVYNTTLTGTDQTMTGIGTSGGGGGEFVQRGHALTISLTRTSKSLTLINSGTFQLPESKDVTINAGDSVTFVLLDESTDTWRMVGRSAVSLAAKKVVYVQDADAQTPQGPDSPIFVDNPTIVYNYDDSFVHGVGGIRVPSGVTKARFGAKIAGALTIANEESIAELSIVKNARYFQNENFGILSGGDTVCVVGHISTFYQSRGVVLFNDTPDNILIRYVHFHIASVVGSLATAGDLSVHILSNINAGGYEPYATYHATGVLPNAKIVAGHHTVQLDTSISLSDGSDLGFVFDFDNDPGAGNYAYFTAGRAQDLTSAPGVSSPLGHWIGNSNANLPVTAQQIRKDLPGQTTSNVADWQETLDGIDSDYPIWLGLQYTGSESVIVRETCEASDDLGTYTHEREIKTPIILVSEGDIYSLFFNGNNLVTDGLDITEFWMEVVE